MKSIDLLLVLFTASALFGACKRPADFKDSASAAAPTQNELKLSIPVPMSSGIGKKEIFAHSLGSPHFDRPRFHVLLTNTSQKSINIWKDWCSWGYGALSFELKDKEGNTWKVHRNPNVIYTHNAPVHWTIAPHENVVLDINLEDEDTWEGIRWARGTPLYYNISAFYEVEPTKESKELSVWTGRIMSAADDYMIYR